MVKVFLLFFFLFTACATVSSRPGEPPRGKTAESARSQFSGSGFLSWKAKDRNVAAPGALVVRHPDQLRLELNDPVGGTLALLVLDGGRFFWFSQDDPVNTSGDVRMLQRLIPIPIEGRELVGALLARHLGDPSEMVTEIRGGLIQVKVEYEDYGMREGVSVPKVTRITLFRQGRPQSRLTWTWSEVRPQIPERENLFLIPVGKVFGKRTNPLR
ncbi:MAG: hypothetical protein HUU37_06305 [Bdellovibrionales bacterium]|nr:hypothetical protein [Bdellovibrionales bacterium]